MAVSCEAKYTGKKENINLQTAGVAQSQSVCLHSEPIPREHHNITHLSPSDMLPFIGHDFQGIYLIRFLSEPLK